MQPNFSIEDNGTVYTCLTSISVLRCIYAVCKVLGFILSDDYFEIKSIIHSFNCLSCFYSYLELQNDFIFLNLFLYFLELSTGHCF